MGWAGGFRGRSPEGWLRCIQTSRHAMVTDVERMRIPRLGPVTHPLPYGAAPEWDYAAGVLTVQVPKVHIHRVVAAAV